MKTIAVFFGGQSPEHDVSVLTGVMTANCLDAEKYKVLPVYVARDGKWYTGEKLLDVSFFDSPNLNKVKRISLIAGDNAPYFVGKKTKRGEPIACAVNCLHGAKGEDGALKGMLDMTGIPLVGSPLLPASLSMDKCATKIFLKGLGVKVLPSAVWKDGADLEEIEARLGYPMMVKPSSLGSSIGVNKAADRAELLRSIAKARKFDRDVLLEKCAVNFMEINAAAYRGRNGIVVSECEMPATSNKFLTFEDKYVSGERTFPAPISEKLSSKIKSLTEKIYDSLGFAGVIRVDYLVCEGVPYVNEINSVPGSLACYLFSDTFAGFSAMLDDMIGAALADFNARASLITKFDCDILRSAGGKGGKSFDKSRKKR